MSAQEVGSHFPPKLMIILKLIGDSTPCNEKFVRQRKSVAKYSMHKLITKNLSAMPAKIFHPSGVANVDEAKVTYWAKPILRMSPQ